MKKLLMVLVALAMLMAVLLPTVVQAQDCSQYPKGSCCREMCCANTTYWFKVGHFDATHNWVIEFVKAKNSKVAAEMLGFRAGYNCFVTRAISYHG